MKNTTRVRLHLSKDLFESIAKQVIAEAKKGDMSGGAYTEAVKMPKEKKEKTPKKEMETRVAEKKEMPKKHSIEKLKALKEKLEKKIHEAESTKEEE